MTQTTKLPPIFTWVFESESGMAGGEETKYVTRLNQDGTLSCQCGGWRFAKKGQPRSCKHTKKLEDEAKGIYAKWKKGEKLPTFKPKPSKSKKGETSMPLPADEPEVAGRYVSLD